MALGPPNESTLRFRNDLVEDTIRWSIERCEFYRERYQDTPVPRTVEELKVLPVTQKDELREAGWKARAEGLTPALRQYTSGSTAPSLEIYRSKEEVDFIQQFFTRLQKSDKKDQGLKRLILALGNPCHGSPTPVPTGGFVMRGNMHDGAFLPEIASSMLLQEHQIPGTESHVQAVYGTLTHVAAFTAILRAYRFPFSQTQVSEIAVTGCLLTNRWRRLLSEAWNCPIYDRFSQTEVFGAATHCEECDAFHFGPEVVPEVVDVHSYEPVRGRSGLLLVTSLYPFVQMQPVIRYVSGDVAKVVDTKCTSGLEAIRLEGRLSHAWRTSEGRVLIPSKYIIEALDDEVMVARSELFRDWFARFPVAREFGPPRADLVGRGATAVLKVMGRFDPIIYPREAKMMEDRLRERLTKTCILDEFEDKLSIEICGPGSNVQGYKPYSV